MALPISLAKTTGIISVLSNFLIGHTLQSIPLVLTFFTCCDDSVAHMQLSGLVVKIQVVAEYLLLLLEFLHISHRIEKNSLQNHWQVNHSE